MVWEKKGIPQDAARELADKAGCDLLTASILLRRGVTRENNLHFYLESDKRYLHNPFLLSGMEDSVERLLSAREEGEKVLVFGDGDVDGITASALLVSYLRETGFEVGARIPTGDEPYGLSLTAIEEAERDGITLIVTVDCGISNAGEVAEAARRGIDVIITDHHNPPDPLPDALAVVNPKRGATDPFRELCGCAVAYKLASALRFALTSKSYGLSLCLLNVRPANDTFIIEAAKMRNLAVIKTLAETVSPGMVGIMDTRLPAFLAGQQILVWDAAPQKKMLAKAFGGGVEFNLFDAAPLVAKEMPATAGKSLLRLRGESRFARYAAKPVSELEVFCSLLVSYTHKRDNLAGSDDDALLQLAALGTIADIMPLENENRILVRAGLKSLCAAPRPGVANLINALDLAGKTLSVRDVAWRLAPAINAARRMGEPETALALLLSEDRAEREKLAAKVVSLNNERKRAGEDSLKVALPQAQESLERYNGCFVVAAGDGAEIPRGVTGLIANRLKDRFDVPALVVSINGGIVTGSLRSTRGYELTALLDSCADFFIDRGGHNYAAGFTMNKERWPAFQEALERLTLSIELQESEDANTIAIDAELPPSFLRPELVKVIDRFEPFGHGNPELMFLVRNVTVRDVSFIGRLDASHVKCTLDAGAHKWPCIYWGAAERVGRDFTDGDRVDVVFNVVRDFFGDQERRQLKIIDLQKTGAAK
jgi:single-stranded-DNA-specific exonuclease